MQQFHSFFHKISCQFFIITICAGLVPIVLFGLLLSFFQTGFSSQIEAEVRHGYEVQLQKNETVLQPILTSFIRQKAIDAARQIEFYLKANPHMTVEMLQSDEEFQRIAIQSVGKTGFTALLGSDDGLIYFHPMAKIQGASIDAIAAISPELHVIMEKSLGGKHAWGSYPWLDGDTRVQKYNYIAPVSQPTGDGVFFNLGAIISSQELYGPLNSTEDISQKTKAQLIFTIEQLLRDFRNKGLVLMISGLLIVVLISFFSGRILSEAITCLRVATQEVKQGNLDVAVTAKPNGELGELIADFNHMVQQLAETTVKKALLQASEEHLQLALQGAELGVLIWDITKDHVVFNECWAKMLGYSLSDISAHIGSWKDCIHPDELIDSEQKLATHLEGRSPLFEVEHRLQTKSGEWLWVLNKGKVIERDNNGLPLRAIITQLDVTSRKEKEQLALQAVMQKEQQKRLESLKTMAGAIAHRFNNSMMVVQGNLDLLALSLPKAGEEYAMAEKAGKAAQGASQVGKMMLNYVGQRALNLKTLSLVDLVEGSVAGLNDFFQSCISLRLTPPDQPLYCSMDQLQMQEVIENIVVNAIESIENSVGDVEISFGTDFFRASSFPIAFQAECLKDGVYAYCQIKDSGHGISSENLSQIFDPFYTTRFLGRGLGLASTVGVMRAHHGAITIASTPKRGTVVTIILPSIPLSPKTKTLSADVAQVETMAFSGDILLVDDDMLVLEIGRKMLEHLGFTVHTSVNGQEAVDRICTQGIDFRAVVLDISMPQMDGIEAMEIIRTHNAHLPILLSSGFSEEDFPFKDTQADKYSGFLGKPFHLSEMQRSLGQILS